MPDPFDESPNPLSAVEALRESSVQQAVSFLNDPRVKNSDPSRAVSFLRQKGISDVELREAYQRCGLPFPTPATALLPQLPHASFPPHPYPIMQPNFLAAPLPMHPSSTRPSWVSVFMGLTAAAGIYTAIRELLRRYIVPLYFPDAARIAEERRRREQHTFLAQEEQIAELRERIQDLLVSSEKTSDQMQHLSKSISSSIALRERELSEASDLRDAIRQLSHSVTASGNTETSHLPRLSSERQSDSIFSKRSARYAHKSGSLAYGHVNQTDTSTLRKSVEIRTDDVFSANTNCAADARSSGESPCSEGHVDSFVAGAVAHFKLSEQGKVEAEDEFMAIKPAEVQESWRKPNAEPESLTQNGEFPRQQTQKPVRGDEDENQSNESDKAPWAMDEGDVIEASKNVEEKSGMRFAIAQQLFQSDIMRVTQSAISKDLASNGPRARPASMPQLDTPLSDPE